MNNSCVIILGSIILLHEARDASWVRLSFNTTTKISRERGGGLAAVKVPLNHNI